MALTRRTFIKTGLAAAASLALPRLGWSAGGEAVKALSFYHLHTGERLSSVPYWERGAYVPEALAELDGLLRDFRTGDVAPIDPALYDVLFALRTRLGTAEPFHIISAYRSPKTNAALHAKSNGVASHSLHMQAKAIDIRLPGVALAALRAAALDLQAGGVGYYPKSDFVHVDTGRVRRW